MRVRVVNVEHESMPPNSKPLSGAYKRVAIARQVEADDQTEFEAET